MHGTTSRLSYFVPTGIVAMRWDTKHTFQTKTYQFAFYSSARTVLSWGCWLKEEWLVPILLWNILLGDGDSGMFGPPCAVDIVRKGDLLGGKGGGGMRARLCLYLCTCLCMPMCGLPPLIEWNHTAVGFLLSFLPLERGIKLSFPILLNTMTSFLI